MPFFDARLADANRVHSCSAVWHHQAPAFHSGCLPHRSFSLEDCVTSGPVTPGAAKLLARMIEARLAFLISGGAGSGRR